MTPTSRPRTAMTWLASGAVVLGLGLGAAGLASAATEDTVPNASTDTSVAAPADGRTTPPVDGQVPPAGTGRPDPATLPNGPGETVLTGDEAAQVTAAALAAQPGATVIRVETDHHGHAYEAHLQLEDGSQLTLYFDESFAPDGSDEGFGPMHGDGRHGHHGSHHDAESDDDGDTPADTTSDTTATTIG